MDPARTAVGARRRRRGVAVVLVVLMGLAAACTPAGPEDPVVLRVVMADDWADTAPVLDVVRAFEADNPGVVVDLVGRSFSDILPDVRAAVDAGDPPDLAHGHAFAAGAVGAAEPLDDVWADGTFDAAAHVPGAMEDVVWGDTTFGIPLDVNAMFLLAADDVTPPRTFAEVEAVARAAAADGRRGLTLSSNAWEAYGWIRAGGGELLEVDGDGTPTFLLDSPAVVDTLGLLGGLVADGAAFGPTTRNTSADAFDLFASGDTDLLLTGTWNVVELGRTAPARAFATAPMPTADGVGEPRTTLGGSSLYVPRGAARRDLAVAFARALTADDVAVALAVEEGRFPPRPALYDRLAEAPGADALAAVLPHARPMRLIAFPEADLAFTTALEEVLTGSRPAAEALADAQAAAEVAAGS